MMLRFLVKTLRSFWRKYKRNRPAIIGLVLFISIVLMALLADWIAPYPPLKTGYGPSLQPPSYRFIMGTDQLGRDILSGIMYGTRISLLIGLSSTIIAVTIGVVVGTFAGFLGGVVDNVLMRITEILMSIPTFVLAIIIVALYGVNIVNIILVIGLLSWPTLARIVRSEVLSLREREFILAVRSTGASDLNIMFDEILPNALPSILPVATLQVATAILTEVGLSFLGLTDPNVMSLGKILWFAQQAFYGGAWWPIIFPGLVIILTTLSVSLIGDGLDDVLKPIS